MPPCRMKSRYFFWFWQINASSAYVALSIWTFNKQSINKTFALYTILSINVVIGGDIPTNILHVCYSFRSWQYLRFYHGGFWLVTVHTNGNFTVLLSERPSCQHHEPIPHSVMVFWHWINQSLSFTNNAVCETS